MINLALSWPQAAGAAAALGAGWAALRLAGRCRPATAGRRRGGSGGSSSSAASGDLASRDLASRDAAGARGLRRVTRAGLAAVAGETGLVLALYALWQFAGSFSVMGPAGALARARWIWRFERAVHLPSEAALQRVFLPHPLLIEFFNLYYAILHFPVLITCLIWLFAFRRERYRRTRTTLAIFTAACLLVQLIPVAPPRMLPLAGMTDTAVRYHQSVYASTSGFDPDQLSAMPSVHVGWALLVAIAVIGAARTRWRWLILAYPAMTTLAVVVTANHFWLDAIVAALLLAAVLAAEAAVRRLGEARRAARAGQPGDLDARPASPAVRLSR